MSLRLHHQALTTEAEKLKKCRIAALFSARKAPYWLTAEGTGVSLDYSKNLLNDAALQTLLQSAAEIPEHINAMFSGAPINFTEKRRVLHSLLRSESDNPRLAAESYAVAEIKERVRALSEGLRSGTITGLSGKKIQTIVNIGIGGSDLGPRMVCHALDIASPQNTVFPLTVEFISNIDCSRFYKILEKLDPETTFFIVSSKSLQTPETTANFNVAQKWLSAHYQNSGLSAVEALKKHAIAITANIAEAQKLGFANDAILPLWEWVGGRYSLWSAIGLSIACRHGYDNWSALLKGAAAMDKHFVNAPLAANMPILLAIIAIWQRNFLQINSLCITPYTDALALFTLYLQQLEMESNGKSVCADGSNSQYQTAPVIWGDVGSNGQHAYFQFLHQGNDTAAVDFIAVRRPSHDNIDNHNALLANAIAQAEVLMNGYQAHSEEGSDMVSKHKTLPGNRSSNFLLLERLDAFHLGALIALYEHKVTVQGWLWNINAFDQFGVEIGKLRARDIYQQLTTNTTANTFDPSTQHLINTLKKSKER